MPATGQRREAGVDIARGVAVLLVVFMHACLRVDGALPAPLAAINQAGATVRMPLLLFITGLLSRGAIRSNSRIAARLAQYVWVFVLWTAIIALAEGWPILRELVAPQSALWYIWSLIVAFALAPVYRRIPPATLLVATVGISSAAQALDVEGAGVPFGIAQCLRFLAFFFIGLHVGAPLLHGIRRHPLAMVAAAVAVILLCGIGDQAARASFQLPLFSVPERLAAAAIALLLCTWLPQVAATQLAAWFGRQSLPIFLGHWLFLEPAAALGRLLPATAFPFLATAFAVSASLLLHRCAMLSGATWLYAVPGWPTGQQDRLTPAAAVG